MDPQEDAADVNKTPAEISCLQHEQNLHHVEALGQWPHPESVGIPLSDRDDSVAQPLTDRSETLQLLEFQDSQLSPALALLPCLEKSHPFSDSTFFQYTDAEFVPLRGFPDLSVISERCPRLSHVRAIDDSHLRDTIYDQATLSQHPLEVPAALSEAEISCCSLSQHSLSPGDHYKGIAEQSKVSCEAENKIDRHMEGEEQGVSQRLAQMSTVISSSADATRTAIDQSEPASNLPNTDKSQLEPSLNVQTNLLPTSGTAIERALQSSSRKQPQGGSLSSSLQKTTGLAVSNITIRDSRMHSHQTVLRDQRGSVSEPGSRNDSANRRSHSGLYVTPASAGGTHMPGLQRVIWSLGNLTAADGSFLSSHPVSQSTPAVPLMRPPQTLTKLSLVHSQEESLASAAASSQNSHSKTGLIPSLDLSVLDQHSSPTFPQTAVTIPGKPSSGSQSTQTVSQAHTVSEEQGRLPPDTPSSDSQALYSDTKMKDQVSGLALGRVQSLPSLSYLQKVDAWTANQSSSRSFYDNLAFKGFDGVSHKNKSQDVVSGSLHQTLPQDLRQPQIPLSSLSGGASPRRVDVHKGQTSESPVNHSQSHSSLSSVLTSIQRDTGLHSQTVSVAKTHDIIPVTRSLSSQSSLLLGKSEGGYNGSATLMDKSSVKPSPLANHGHFSDVSSSFNMSSTLSSSHGSYHGEQSMRASVGAASSVVSLEVDNYAPYWTSRPASPPQSRELNIEDRIPLYLQNLGIDQSPSTILNPFTRRGPIREPEFSPTDLCTIKGSTGTPTKSTQLSEGDSPQKETISSSSQLSADSNASVTRQMSVQSQPIIQDSVRTILSQPNTPPRLHSTLHPSDTPRSEGSCGISSQLSPDSIAVPVLREEVKDEDSFVGSGTLHEIRRLLGRAEGLVSDRSSLTSSPGSHRLSESDTSLVSLGRNTSLSASGNFSALLIRSSSDSALKGSLSSSQGARQLSTRSDALTLNRDESLKSRDLCVTPRRAEPEGCSAADPDKAKQSTALSAMQKNSSLTAGNLPQNQKTDSAVVDSSDSSPSRASAEAGSLSDSSSESSLAARVAKLLQSESPVSMVTSRPSTADPEDSRAREWILMKLSGRQCESLGLNAEDRKRIEDIKIELLLNTQHTKWSSDSEGSAQSSTGAGSHHGKGFVGVRSMESQVSDVLQKATQKPSDSNVLHYTSVQQDLEAKVHQIALREGFSLPSLTSVSIATTRRTPSPQLPSDVAGTMELGNVGDRHEYNDHHKETDTNLEVAYPQQRLESVNILNRSDREEQMDPREKNEITDNKDDDKENPVKSETQIVQGMSHMDHIVTGSNQNLSSAASDTAFANKSHLSHIHVTLSPRPKHQSHFVNSFKDVPAPRHFPVMSSTTTEQQRFNTVSNQAKSFKHKEPVQGQNEDRVYPHLQSRYPQDFTPTQSLTRTSRTHLLLEQPKTAGVPTLLPYKPHGSSELFYVPQADPELSPDCSETTVESSHPGSDDAVPPRFNKEMLGSRELEDNAVMPKHKEGIYSKRASVKKDFSNLSRNGFPESAVSFTGRYNRSAPEASDVYEKFMDDDDNFVPLHMEADYSIDDLHLHSRTMQEPKLPLEPQHLPSQPVRKSSLTKNRPDRKPHDVSIEISSSLDQLWRRFNEKWSMEETRPINEGDTSLLDRLKRLSRLIHNTTPTDKTQIKQPDSINRGHEIRSSETERPRTEEGEERVGTRLDVAPGQAWAEQEYNPENVHRCPAEKDESMESSSSLSTIDTERLLRAFGPHRVTSKGLKSSDSLLRLNNSINKQKTGRRKPSTRHAAVSVNTENISTDDSTVTPDYLSSSSTVSVSPRGVSHGVAARRSKVKLLSKSVQAGDLEIVINGTRRHTRDVGTIFPSPGASSNTRTSNKLSRAVQGIPIPTASTANPIQTPSALKRESSNRKSIQTRYPNGVSWFVSADELKSNGRKENQPQSESEPCVSQAWFEPYSRTRPWREPAREAIREPLRERQIHVEQEKTTECRTAVGSVSSDKPSALVRLSLQEALELHRPQFVSRSRERIKRLELLVGERRLQAVFNREREELFNYPAPSRPLIPAPVPRKRVVPRKEMFQRSKHWVGKKAHNQRIDKTDRLRRKYAQLPEVQRKREEERRRAEYSSYRLNAQLFNKKVTNRVLGRRAPWQ